MGSEAKTTGTPHYMSPEMVPEFEEGKYMFDSLIVRYIKIYDEYVCIYICDEYYYIAYIQYIICIDSFFFF